MSKTTFIKNLKMPEDIKNLKYYINRFMLEIIKILLIYI